MALLTAHGRERRWPRRSSARCRSPGAPGRCTTACAAPRPATRCRAKTGTLSNVSALAGYCDTRGGGRVAFAFLMNCVYPWTARAPAGPHDRGARPLRRLNRRAGRAGYGAIVDERHRSQAARRSPPPPPRCSPPPPPPSPATPSCTSADGTPIVSPSTPPRASRPAQGADDPDDPRLGRQPRRPTARARRARRPATSASAPLRKAGFNVLTWDSRGFGQSGGTVTVDSRTTRAATSRR